MSKVKRSGHDSDCAVHNMPAEPNGLCNCGFEDTQAIRRDAARYRKMRDSPHWRLYEIIWEEAYLGMVNATGERLDRLVDDELPETRTK